MKKIVRSLSLVLVCVTLCLSLASCSKMLFGSYSLGFELGGQGVEETLRIEPTLLDDVTPESACMQEEIFGPLLPKIGRASCRERV